MYHFFVEPYQVGEKEIKILGSDVNHIKNVLRMRTGEQIAVSDGFGHAYGCRITGLEEERVTAEIITREEVHAELPSRLILFQCLPKGDKMELIIQKAVELGAASVVPVASRRCVVKLDAKKEENKRRRWNAVAESAAKQSGRGMIPQVAPTVDFAEALLQAKELDVCLMPYECADELLGEDGMTAMEQTRALLKQIKKGQSVGIFIGPEGGFEKAEVQAAME
ncbi:MAG TPA: 16S rRNA methyltransferase, partial [Lachnospiraceae bacterium]|nr:16S rRNA methyltransferase [Lachnospiraceae bacterium]